MKFPRPPRRRASSQNHESGALPRSRSSSSPLAPPASLAVENTQTPHNQIQSPSPPTQSGDGDGTTRSKRLSVDCSTLTDLHSSPAVPEVEVISLLDEELPRYRLRADYLTEFGGYQNSDFADASIIETPCLPDDEGGHGGRRLIGLTSEQAEATLEYFVSSGDRLSQMTKTYHDVEAITRCRLHDNNYLAMVGDYFVIKYLFSRLLEEKEKDLELAAKIGQELLERNRFLDDKVAQLEAAAVHSTELITQLRHDLQVKTDLLRVFSNDAASSDTGDDSSPLHGGHISVDLLQRKISELERDNRKLHEEATEVGSNEHTFNMMKYQENLNNLL